ncbi:MAG TPA: PLD nuclease N-terminal domain-containing protein [Armatimonadota bacterium]|nr:PLD nuclease N-terminal domain-containing protein [Armatimonadota bacterium]
MAAHQVVGLLWLFLNVWAMYDVLRRPVEIGNKLMWLVLVWLIPFAGVLIYLAMGRKYLSKRERWGESSY